MFFGAARLGLFDANNIGGKAYFAGGYVTSTIATTKTYNLTNGAVGLGSNNLATARFTQSGFGNSVYGFSVAGFTGSVRTTAVAFFAFSTDTNNNWTWSQTGFGTTPAAVNECRGSSSPVKGYSWGGNTGAQGRFNYQLTYSAGTWVNSTALNWSLATSYPSVHSNSTNAILINGNNGSTTLNQRLLYTFATEANVFTNNAAYEATTQGAGTGDQTNMTVLGGMLVSGSTYTRAVVKYNIVTGSYVFIRTLSVANGFSNNDAAGNDYVGVWAGKWTSQAAGTIQEAEWAQTYATDASTLLGSYLAGANIYTLKTESMGSFSSTQIS